MIDQLTKTSISETLKGAWVAQSVIEEWAHNPNRKPSSQMIPRVYQALMTGRSHGEVPSLYSICRTYPIRITHTPPNLCLPAEYVYLRTAQFSDDLDKLIESPHRKLNKQGIENIITDAAWAYYVFVRIHPFVDGNGRIGRMLAKLVLKRSGLKDPIFHDSRWYKTGRSEHLEALDQVNETCSFTPLESYLAQSLLRAYDSRHDQGVFEILQELVDKRTTGVSKDESRGRLSDLWSGFAGIPMYGN